MAGRPRTRDPKPEKPETLVPAASASPEAPDAPVDEAPRPGPGRPTKLDDFMLELARRCGKAGLIDEQVAIMLDVAVSTFYAWTKANPEFSEALKRGQSDPFARTKNTLYQKANGFTVPEEKVFLHEGKPVKVETYRYIPPSDTALIFWLCNKLPEEFKHIQHIQNSGGIDLHHKGSVAAPMLHDMNRALAAMGESPAAAGRAPATPPARPAKAPGSPGKVAAPARSQDLAQDDDEVELLPTQLESDPNPPSGLIDLSDLEGDDE